MSYKDYSTDAVKAIMQKTRNGQETGRTASFIRSSGLSLDELIEVGAEIGLNPDEVKNAARVYDHPDVSQSEKANKTHILTEKEFVSSIPAQLLWKKIETELTREYSDEYPGKARIYPVQFKWSNVNEENLETVVSLKKNSNVANLKVSRRLSFRSPLDEGMIQSTYLSLLFSGFLYVLIRPEIPVFVAIFVLFWILQSIIFYGLMIHSRKKKIRDLEMFADEIIDRITPDNNKDL